jgi:hypothetical protein
MLVKAPHTHLLIPKEVEWCTNLILHCSNVQKSNFVEHPFTYLTVRCGPTLDSDDDVWHTDGFSMKTPHLPEQNYLWSNHSGTESLEQCFFDIPRDFDPRVHNLHKYIQKRAKGPVHKASDSTIIITDPYVVHRRPKNTGWRNMVRVSFVPIIIEDDANTPNPLIPVREFGQIGKDIRDRLSDYDN